MECDAHTADPPTDPFCPDVNLAQRAPVCVLISAPSQDAWETARKIAHACGAGLSWIDCDCVSPDETAMLLRDHVVAEPGATAPRILFLREIQVLSPPNQQLLNRLLAMQRPPVRRPRLIASSSLSLYEWVRGGLFDETLFYKLNAVHIKP